MKDHYTYDRSISLTEAQQQEILERDRLYEEGKEKTYSLDEIIFYFRIKEK